MRIRKSAGIFGAYEQESRLEEFRVIKKSFVDIQKDIVEIKESFPLLQSKGGLPILYENGTVYVDASDSHSLIIGATGSKKTRLLVMPMVKLLAYAEESMIISDPKAEVYERTAYEMKKAGYDIVVLNFRNLSVGDCWNPFSIPQAFYRNGDFDRAYEFINDIALNIMQPSKGKNIDPFWDDSAANLFFGLSMLAIQECPSNRDVTIKDILKLRSELFDSKGELKPQFEDKVKTNFIIYQSLLGTIVAAEKTTASILTTFDQKTRFLVYQNNLLQMLSQNTISFESVGSKKTAVFLIMPDEKTTFHALISLFIKQSYEYFIYLNQTMETDGFERRINYILDEFSTLPTINDFPAMITAARSRNIRFNLVIQSQNQLVKRYGEEAQTIKANCNNWFFLTSKETVLLDEISKLGGKDAGGKSLFTVSALQHLKKDEGEVLMICGRLFPFISNLADISKYDKEIFEKLPFEKRKPYKECEDIISIMGIEENDLTIKVKEKNNQLLNKLEEANKKNQKYEEQYNNLLETNKSLSKEIHKLENKIKKYKPTISVFTHCLLMMFCLGLFIYSCFRKQINFSILKMLSLVTLDGTLVVWIAELISLWKYSKSMLILYFSAFLCIPVVFIGEITESADAYHIICLFMLLYTLFCKTASFNINKISKLNFYEIFMECIELLLLGVVFVLDYNYYFRNSMLYVKITLFVFGAATGVMVILRSIVGFIEIDDNDKDYSYFGAVCAIGQLAIIVLMYLGYFGVMMVNG